RDIHSWFGGGNSRYIFNKGGIAKRVFLPKQIHRIRESARQLHRRSADTAIPNDHGSDTLRELGKHLGRANQIEIVVGVDIDKSRREDVAVALQRFCGRITAHIADSPYTTLRNRDGTGLRLIAAPVENLYIADHRVAGRQVISRRRKWLNYLPSVGVMKRAQMLSLRNSRSESQ